MLRASSFHELWSLAQVAVGQAHRETLKACTAPDELDFVFHAAVRGAEHLARLWTTPLQRDGVALRVTGVYCHLTPQAKITSGPRTGERCELGDLLVVFDHHGAKRSRRAVVIQAKKLDQGGCQPTDTQLTLYRDWPSFELVGRDQAGRIGFEKGDRIISERAFARYGLVSPTLCRFHRWPHHSGRWRCDCPPPWTLADPLGSIIAAGGEELGHALASMLYERVIPARGAECMPLSKPYPALGSGNDLSITVQEVLDVTATRLTRSSRRAGARPWDGQRRGQGFDAFVQVAGPGVPGAGAGMAFLSGGAHPPDGGVLLPPDEEEPGFSVLLVETFAG